MNLLICTQKIDKDDDVLGFMHGWVLEFSKYFDNVTVVCLFEGKHELPINVKVLSLGKEGGRSRLKYILNFYQYIWREKNNYDAVFVHMNPEYVVLGWPIWVIMGKKITLWYNHLKGGIRLRIANLFCDRLFYTSTFAYITRFSKSRIMPAGIDTRLFKVDSGAVRVKNSILSLGRISPVKKVDLMVGAAILMDQNNAEFTFDIYGNAPDRDKEYFERVKAAAANLERKAKIKFSPGISNYDTPKIYNAHEVFLNATQSGSLDKSILEAMACGMLVLVSNKSFQNKIPDVCLFEEKNMNDLAGKLSVLLTLDEYVKNRYRSQMIEYVESEHSLTRLAVELKNALLI
ncbi:MAG: glycosyltransferase family 4 protein [Candidatus Vogelbacteria bacterium]|nr:glycosyltransferase family 4 protein [Candidatus Vogelbacteria bacterium]